MELVTRYIIKAYTPQARVSWPDNLTNPDQKRKNDFWLTKEGEIIYPADMDNKHLLNTISLVHRSRHSLSDFFKTYSYLDEVIIYGPHGLQKIRPGSLKHINQRYKQLWKLERQYMRLRQEAIARGLGRLIK